MSEHSNSSEALLARAYSLSNDEETKALYCDWAETYDETMLTGLGYLTPFTTAHLFSTVVIEKSSKILDIGCGTGLAGQNLTEMKFSNIDALDYSSAMLTIARVRESNGNKVYNKCIQADVNEPLNIDTCIYDAIICTGLFTHAHVGARCLPELFRILKPNSFFVTTVHKDIWESGGFDKIVKALEAEGVLRIHSQTMGSYFETDKEPQGYYIIWECLK